MPEFLEVNDGCGTIMVLNDSDVAVINLPGLLGRPGNPLYLEIARRINECEMTGFDLISLGFYDCEGFENFRTETQLSRLEYYIETLPRAYKKVIVIANSYSSLAAIQLKSNRVAALAMVSPAFIVDQGWETSKNKHFIDDKGEKVLMNFDFDRPTLLNKKFHAEGLTMNAENAQKLIDGSHKKSLIIWGEKDLHYQVAQHACLEFPEYAKVLTYPEFGHSLVDPNWLKEIVNQLQDFIGNV